MQLHFARTLRVLEQNVPVESEILCEWKCTRAKPKLLVLLDEALELLAAGELRVVAENERVKGGAGSTATALSVCSGLWRDK